MGNVIHKVHFGFLENFPIKEWEVKQKCLIASWFEQEHNFPYQWWDDPESADIIVILEPNDYRNFRALPKLLNEPLLRDYANKVFCFNVAANTCGCLSGIYAGLESPRYARERHRIWCYTYPANPQFEQLAPLDSEADLDFSFRGALSHNCRKQLARLFAKPSKSHSVVIIDRWFNHTESEKIQYAHEIQKSRFVLCPRGISASSHRLYETMAMGRCPVIISDAWIRPDYVDWDDFALFCREDDIESIPDLVEQHRREWRERGQKARKAWESFFSPGNRTFWALEGIRAIQRERPADHNEHDAFAQWSSRTFYRNNGWCLDQRIRNKLRKCFCA